jgi:hypothetical protein
MPIANPADLPATFPLHDLRHQFRPAQQRGQRQSQSPTQSVAIESPDPCGLDFQRAGPGERDQEAGAVVPKARYPRDAASAASVKARACCAAFASAAALALISAT